MDVIRSLDMLRYPYHPPYRDNTFDFVGGSVLIAAIVIAIVVTALCAIYSRPLTAPPQAGMPDVRQIPGKAD